MHLLFNYHSLVFTGSCHLFRKCDMRCQCKGCSSGPSDCSAQCRIPSTKGPGRWYCDGHNNTIEQVRHYDYGHKIIPALFSGPCDTKLRPVLLRVWGQASANCPVHHRPLGPGCPEWSPVYMPYEVNTETGQDSINKCFLACI